jgi:UDP-2,3-diacylglucosamine pyrophosphatase LpxH
MMACALEELLDSRSTAEDLAAKLDEIFHEYGSKTVQDARLNRPGIRVPKSLRNAPSSVFVYREWIAELYKLRGMIVHGNDLDRVEFGWHIFEHLVMAAYVFPLLVKLLLQRDGLYEITDDDRDHCYAVDWLLSSNDWAKQAPRATSSEQTNWRNAISDTKFERFKEQWVREFKKASPGS